MAIYIYIYDGSIPCAFSSPFCFPHVKEGGLWNRKQIKEESRKSLPHPRLHTIVSESVCVDS